MIFTHSHSRSSRVIDNFLQTGEATEQASPYAENYPTLQRTFAFLDVSNFTEYTKQRGTHSSAQMLHIFRNAVRVVVGRHGIRVAKWLGDGVMLVGVHTRPVYETVAELNKLFSNQEFSIHSGIACGKVIIFEEDDFVGMPVNIAARLCDHAQPSEILAYNVKKLDLPLHTHAKRLNHTITVRGIGELDNIYRLSNY